VDIIFYISAAVILIGAALASIAIWAPRPTWVRFVAVAIVILFIPAMYLQMTELLSRPKPMSFEWYERATDEAVVLGVSLKEQVSIHLWLQVDGSSVPRNFVVPWNVKLAEKLEDAMEGAVRENSTVVLKDPFSNRSLEEWGDLNVEIIRSPVPPAKIPHPPSRIFNPRETQI